MKSEKNNTIKILKFLSHLVRSDSLSDNSSSRKGFTLIEMLTAISILGVIGAICAGVITVTLRTTKKSDLIEVARQESDTALTQMVRTIRYAQSLSINGQTSCVPTATAPTISVIAVGTHAQTTYSCNAGTIQSNGVSIFNTTALTVTSCSFACEQPTLNDPPTITIQYTLTQASAGIFAETSFSLPFQSSVTMRNVQ
jgi:prepilin-type N-terminal cleavage/methylation domain-containing protein